MIRTLLILSLTIFSSFLSAQDSARVDSLKVRKNNYAKWSIGISFSTDYSYRVLEPMESSDTNAFKSRIQCVDSLNYIEKATISWTAGIPVSYHFNKFISAKTGIYFSNKTFKSKGFVQTNGIYFSWAVFKKDNWEKSHFIFIEIPFALEFTYRPKKMKNLTFSTFVGVSGCSNIEEHHYNSRAWQTDYNSPELESSYSKLYVDKFNLFYLGYTAGLKMTYKLNEKFIIGFEPVYKFYGSEFVSSSSLGNSWATNKISRLIMGVREKPYSMGINLSLEFTK